MVERQHNVETHVHDLQDHANFHGEPDSRPTERLDDFPLIKFPPAIYLNPLRIDVTKTETASHESADKLNEQLAQGSLKGTGEPPNRPLRRRHRGVV